MNNAHTFSTSSFKYSTVPQQFDGNASKITKGGRVPQDGKIYEDQTVLGFTLGFNLVSKRTSRTSRTARFALKTHVYDPGGRLETTVYQIDKSDADRLGLSPSLSVHIHNV